MSVQALDQKQLESMTINGFDAVLLLMNLSIEIVAALSPTPEAADNHLVDLANRLDGFAQAASESRTKFLMSQLARALIATEKSG